MLSKVETSSHCTRDLAQMLRQHEDPVKSLQSEACASLQTRPHATEQRDHLNQTERELVANPKGAGFSPVSV